MQTEASPFAAAHLLHMLKETCALHCLLALHVLGPLPVTQRAIMDLTSFDDEAVRKGLNKLLTLGLASCSGDDHRSNWRLGPVAGPLALPLEDLLASPASPDSPSFKEEEKEEENIDIISLIELSSSYVSKAPKQLHAEFDPTPDSAATPATAATTSESPIPAIPSTPSSTPNNPQKTLASWSLRGERPVGGEGLDVGEKVLRHHFYLAFDAANIYLQFRRPLADGLLAEDGPTWLRHTLGWLCYAQRRLPHVQRGAVVYLSLRDRLPCDLAYHPPLGLSFADALAWAVRGGEDEREDEPEDDEAGDDQAFRVSETLKVSDGPEDVLWRGALDLLRRELTARVVETHLAPLRLVSLADGRCVLAAPSPQARDWLANRLARVVARALSELAAAAVTVEFVVDT